MDNPWGNAWSDVNKDPVQEVIVKPKEEGWAVTSPVSGDIGVAWTSEWDAPSTKQSNLQAKGTAFPSTSPAWDSVLGAMGDTLSPGFEASTGSPKEEEKEEESEKEQVESESITKALSAFDEPSSTAVFAPVDEPIMEEAFSHDEKPITTNFHSLDVDDEAWRSLSQVAVVVGTEDAGWETAWKPDFEEAEERVESPKAPVDEWTLAVEEKTTREAHVPPEIMDMILERYKALEKQVWPEEDLEAARSGPAPRDEWQGGMENVDGLASLVNRYLPPPPVVSPVRFEGSQISTSFNHAMRMTRSYALVQSSPLSRLIKTSDRWDSSAPKGKPFVLESWLVDQAATLSATILSRPTSSIESKSSGVLGRFSRPSIDAGGRTSSRSHTPRPSQDITPQILGSLVSSTSSPTASTFSPISTPSTAAAPSAVSRFFNRWSRRADEPKPPTPVNLRSDELDYLDMVPAMNGATAEAIKKELGDAAAYPGSAAMGMGGMFSNAAPSSRRSLDTATKRRTMPATTNLSQLTSEDFDNLLDAQIAEVEELKLRENLIATSLISESSDSRYGRLGGSLWGGKKEIAGAQPLTEGSSQMSNSLFDDDDFDAFLAAPARPQQSSKPLVPSAPTTYGTPPTAQRSFSPTPVANLRSSSPSTQTSPAPTRQAVAIMSGGSRPSTPSNFSPAPLLPPPPGRPGSTNLLSGTPLIAPPQSTLLSNKPISSITSSIGDLGGLLDLAAPSPAPVAVPKALQLPKPTTTSTTASGLSAQDLSFFEGL